MEGYTSKKFHNVRLLTCNDIVSRYSSTEWQDLWNSIFKKNRSFLQKKGKYKSIFITKLPLHDGEQRCMVKTYKNYGRIKRLKNIFHPSKAFYEFQIAAHIQKRGIPTIVPIFVAEIKRHGLVSESFHISPLLEDTLDAKKLFLNQNANLTCTVSVKNNILRDFGILTAKIFQNGIFQYDYSLNNFLLKRQGDSYQIYFVDFERVKIKKRISADQELKLLAKLNRVGREVSCVERLRFLKGYMEEKGESTEGLKSFALALQKKTFEILRKDLKKQRLTNIYTHGTYEKLNSKGYRGIYRIGYNSGEIISKTGNIAENVHRTRITLRCGTGLKTLAALQYKGTKAQKMWSIISTLIIAGLPIDLPHILLQGKHTGFIFFKIPDQGEFPSPETVKKMAGLKTMKAIQTNFSRELKSIDAVLSALRG